MLTAFWQTLSDAVGGVFRLSRTRQIPVPKEPSLHLYDGWPGDADAGRRWLDNKLVCFGQEIDLLPCPWQDAQFNAATLYYLNGFSWLRDLRELGGEAARLKARQWLQEWLEQPPPSEGEDIAVVGERLTHWIGHYSFFCDSAADDFRHTYFAQIARDSLVVRRALARGEITARPLAICKGALWSSLFLAGALENDRDFARCLTNALSTSLNADGGAKDRRADSAAHHLMDLIDIRQALRAASLDVGPDVNRMIEACAAGLRLLRHGDGGFALFNGCTAQLDADIDSLLTQSEVKARALMALPETGYFRLVNGRSLVLVDGGIATLEGSHTAPLAFELSDARQRLVVNCGAAPLEPKWHQPLRATAAHSTLVIDDNNAVGASHAHALETCQVVAGRDVEDRNQLFEGEHDGYVPRYGMVHRRRLFLDASGADLRGEDTLLYNGGPTRRGRDFALRFHLHPRVSASLVQNQTEVLLRLSSGKGWRFRVSDGLIALHESVYFGDGRHSRSQQIIVTGSLDSAIENGDMQLKWAFQREG